VLRRGPDADIADVIGAKEGMLRRICHFTALIHAAVCIVGGLLTPAGFIQWILGGMPTKWNSGDTSRCCRLSYGCRMDRDHKENGMENR